MCWPFDKGERIEVGSYIVVSDSLKPFQPIDDDVCNWGSDRFVKDLGEPPIEYCGHE